MIKLEKTQTFSCDRCNYSQIVNFDPENAVGMFGCPQTPTGWHRLYYNELALLADNEVKEYSGLRWDLCPSCANAMYHMVKNPDD